MERPIPLESIYVRVNILGRIPSREGKTLEEIIRTENNKGYGSRIREKIDGNAILHHSDRLIILGKPGSGKTTFLKYLALRTLKNSNESQSDYLPIIIYLKEISNDGSSIVDYIVKKISDYSSELREDFIYENLKEGKFILLFDGLDEISKSINHNSILREIKIISEKYFKNKILLSCRTAAYNYNFEDFTEVEIAEFNLIQIRQFIENWFSGNKDDGIACWENLENESRLLEIATSPLLLTLLCITFSRDKKFPKNKSVLYERSINQLLSRWDKSRMVDRDDIYSNLTNEQKITLFSRIAYGNFIEESYIFRGEILSKSISNILSLNFGLTLNLDGEILLSAIESQHGILVQRAVGLFSFAHLSFQEYFCAKYISEYSIQGSVESAVNNYLFESRWREVFLFISGISLNSDTLIISIVSRIEKEIKLKALDFLFAKIDNSIDSEKTKYDSLRRIISLFLLSLNTRYYEFLFTMEFVELVEKFSSIFGMNLTDTIDEVESLCDKIYNEESLKDSFGFRGQDYLIGLDIDREYSALFLSERYNIDLKEISNFSFSPSSEEKLHGFMSIFNSYKLLLECIEHSYAISNSTKEYLLKDLFSVLTDKS